MEGEGEGGGRIRKRIIPVKDGKIGIR